MEKGSSYELLIIDWHGVHFFSPVQEAESSVWSQYFIAVLKYLLSIRISPSIATNIDLPSMETLTTK